MASIAYKGQIYSGVSVISDTNHLTALDGSGNEVNAQTLLNNILGDFATIQNTSIASQNYAVGSYIIFNGLLYKVTSAITSGETISVGTNVSQTNVGIEISGVDAKFNNRNLWWGSQAIASTSGNSGTLATISDSKITANHVMTKLVFADQSKITSSVTCTTSNGQAVLTGKSTGTTTAEIFLELKDN